MRWFILVIWLLCLAGGIGVMVQTPILTDLNLFMPSTDNDAHPLLNPMRKGPASRLLIAGITGGSTIQRARISQALYEGLQANPLFVRVSNGKQNLSKIDQDFLFKYRYLLSPTLDRPNLFSPEQLHSALQQRLAELRSPLSAWYSHQLPADPSGELMQVLHRLQPAHAPQRQHGVWFSPDQHYALLLIETHAPSFDPATQRIALQTIQQHFQALLQTQAYAPDLNLILSGPGAFAALAQQTIKTEVHWLSIAACLPIVLILWWAYRDWRLLLLNALPLGTAIVMAIAGTSLLFGGIHGITLAFGVTLLGIAIDYPIHLFSHWCQNETAQQSVKRIRSTLLLSALTTSLGYLMLASTDFTGLRQLGMFTAIGIVSAFLSTTLVLPALLTKSGSTSKHRFSIPKWGLPMPYFARRGLTYGLNQRWLLYLSGFSIAIAVILTTWSGWENDLSKLTPLPTQLLQRDSALRHALGAPEIGNLITVQGTDIEQALQRCEALRPQLDNLVAKEVISGYEMGADYLPSAHTQRQRQQNLPSAEQLKHNLQQAQVGLGFKTDLFAPFLHAIEMSRTLPILELSTIQNTLLGAKTAPLFMQQQHTHYALILLSGVQDRNVLAQHLADLPTGVRYLDVKVETEDLIAQFRATGLTRAVGGGVLMILILWIGLRSLGQSLTVLTPVLLALAIEVAVLSVLGQRLNLFHLIAMLLVLSLAIDYSLFFNRPQRDKQEYQRTQHAIIVCAASTIMVFGLLGLSTIPVLQALGRTVTLGVCISLFILVISHWYHPHEAKK